MAAPLAPHIRLGNYCSANITIRAALPQNRLERLIGSQAEFEINLIRIPFYIIKLFRIKFILKHVTHKINLKDNLSLQIFHLIIFYFLFCI